ncbi:MAG TPA: cellulase family glycosylhydrolase, partial [Acidimicrobiia bacterium]|nr:cellulase family glycosylhydrolase [Acidimicrobiia bacterium]
MNAYVVNVYVGNVLQASRLLAPSMTRQTVGGLSNHVTYRFTVAANNTYGLSVASAMTTNVTPSLGASAGVEFECNSSSWSDAERQSVLDTVWNSGARWVRIPVDWSTVEPTAKKSYNFALNDKCVSLAKKRGFRVLQTLSATPAWANGNRGASVPPTTVTDYGDIAQVMAARYNGSHGVGRVDAWEIWNEPNTSAWTGSVAQYVALVKAAYPRVHKGFVHAAVVVGAPAYNSSLFVRTLYDAGLTGASFDVISVHPFQNPSDSAPDAADPAPGSYGMPADGYMTHTPTVASLLASHGDDGKPIWWTAFGWSTCSGTITGQSTSCVTEQ